MCRKVVILFLALAARAEAERSYPYARMRYLEGNVTLQRASELEPSDAGVNFPVMPGDRVWTAPAARAEIQFADGSFLRLDERTKVDFFSFAGGGDRENLIRQWSGGTFLKLAADEGGSFRVDTPAGSIFPASEGLFRIEVHEGESVVLSVYQGVAELASQGGSVLVRGGQRSLARAGERPEQPFAFNTADLDEFAAWSDERDQRRARRRNIEAIPEEVIVYTDDLDEYGDWRYDATYGHVWYPGVSVGWSPYLYGRWAYTAFGWTWCSYESWGWAPYHYGRWGYNHYGWYWIPGSYWGPAWVSWAIGPGWLGWCPLGYYDRPVVVFDSVFYRGGRAVPRAQASSGWNFVRNEDLPASAIERVRLRPEDVRGSAREARLLESGAVLDQDLRPRAVGAAAMTRLPKGGLRPVEGTVDSVEPDRAPGAVSRGGVAPPERKAPAESEGSGPGRAAPDRAPSERARPRIEKRDNQSGRLERLESPDIEESRRSRGVLDWGRSPVTRAPGALRREAPSEDRAESSIRHRGPTPREDSESRRRLGPPDRPSSQTSSEEAATRERTSVSRGRPSIQRLPQTGSERERVPSVRGRGFFDRERPAGGSRSMGGAGSDRSTGRSQPATRSGRSDSSGARSGSSARSSGGSSGGRASSTRKRN